MIHSGHGVTARSVLGRPPRPSAARRGTMPKTVVVPIVSAALGVGLGAVAGLAFGRCVVWVGACRPAPLPCPCRNSPSARERGWAWAMMHNDRGRPACMRTCAWQAPQRPWPPAQWQPAVDVAQRARPCDGASPERPRPPVQELAGAGCVAWSLSACLCVDGRGRGWGPARVHGRA